MLGRVNEIIKETQKAWINFLGEHRELFTSLEIKRDTVDTPVEGKGKWIMGSSPLVFKNIKIVEIEQLVDKDVQTNTETPVNIENIVQHTNIEYNCLPDTNVQVEDIVPAEEPAVTQTTPSGKASGASEEVIKDKTSKEKTGEFGREPVVGPSLLTIDTSRVENKTIIEMSPTELMMMDAQKLMKEGTTDKVIIDQ